MEQHDINLNNALVLLAAARNVDYIGEPVSQFEHALQCAYFAEQSGHSEEVILASLYHDIGHFASATKQLSMAGLGIVRHEWIGAKLAYDNGFSAKVSLLIGYHVDAKRYLAGKKPTYYDRLSAASKQTLLFQGGPMSNAEREVFENNPYFKEILQVRINDEKGKKIAMDVPDLIYYRERIKNHLIETAKIKKIGKPVFNLTDYIDDNWVNKIKIYLASEC